MLEENKDPYIHMSWYDFLKHEGLYDYSKKGKLTNNTSD